MSCDFYSLFEMIGCWSGINFADEAVNQEIFISILNKLFQTANSLLGLITTNYVLR